MLANQFIPQMEPWFGPEEKAEVNRYLDEGGWLTEFKRTAQFEREIAEYTGTKHCIVVNNGTVSLTLAALALGLKAEDEVLVPNYTMIATANSVQMLGCVPVFVDVEPETLCMDLALAAKAVTARTRALILVNANGRTPKAGIRAFESFCKKRNIYLIEDSAQSLGSHHGDGRHCGAAGMMGSFSFSAPKVISTGQGGALVTDSDELSARLRKLKDFGRAAGGGDIHNSIGYNFKFTELQACVGIAQMKKLAWRVKRKKAIWHLYEASLKGVIGIRLFDHDTRYETPWFIDSLVERRDGLVSSLKQGNIGVRVMYPPINKQLAYQTSGEYPVSELVGHQGLWLPSSSQLTDENIEYICASIRRFYET